MKIRTFLLKLIGTILFLIFGVPFFISISHSQNENILPFANSKRIVCQDVSIHYRVWEPEQKGVKPWCLLVHGFSGSTYSWRHTVPALIHAGYTVVAVDIPPYGYSDRNPKINASFTSRAQLLNAFMQTFPDSVQWHIAGHSMGGGIVQALAIMYPENIASVTFVAGTLFSALEKSKAMTPLLMRIPPIERFLVVLGEHVFIKQKRVKKFLESAYGKGAYSDEVAAYLNPLLLEGTSLAIIRSMTRSEEIASIRAIDLKIPALAIWGDLDTWVPLSFSEKAIEETQNIILFIIQGSAHCPMETHPEIFNKHYLNFLESIQGE